MKKLALLSVVLLARAQLNPVEEGAKHIYDLNDGNFENIVQRGSAGAWLINFTTETCRNCAKLRPVFSKLAYDHRESNVKFGQVDCVRSPGVCSLMRVASYPSVYLLRDEKIYRYGDERTVEKLGQFALSEYQLAPSTRFYLRAPSLLETALTSLDTTVHQLRVVYQTSNVVMRSLLALFFGFTCAFVLTAFGALVAFCLKLERKIKAH